VKKTETKNKILAGNGEARHNLGALEVNGRIMLWRIYMLLGKDREKNNETTAVARQQSARQ
jgi:hypothetical protein